VLRRATARPGLAKLPPAVAKSRDLAVKAFTTQKWAEAERHAGEVTRQVPVSAPAWDALGLVRQMQQKPAAREAFVRAVAVDPAALLLRLHLARAEASSQLWPEAAKTAWALIENDAAPRYPEAYLLHGIASSMTRYGRGALQLPNLPGPRTELTQRCHCQSATRRTEPPQQRARAFAHCSGSAFGPAPEPEFTLGGEAWGPRRPEGAGRLRAAQWRTERR
jgi:hypothetical protein